MREANVTNVKVGDKVVYKDAIRRKIKEDEGYMYGKIRRVENLVFGHIVNWVNHKGLVKRMDYCNLNVGSSDFYFYELL